MRFSQVAIVFNPVGGSAKPDRIKRLTSAFEACGASVTCHATTPEASSARKLSEAAVASGANLIVAVGGDGTVREVALVAIRTNVPLAVYQGGTSNVFAESFYPVLEPERFVQLIYTSGTLQRLDVIEVNYEAEGSQEATQEICIVGICTGPLAAAVTGAPRSLKKLIGSLAYAARVLPVLFRSEPQAFRLKTKRGEHQETAKTVIALNLHRSVVPVDIVRSCNASDGVMDLLIVKISGFWQALTTAFYLLAGRLPCSVSYQRYREQELEISAAIPFDVNLDGEAVRTKSLALKVLPGVLPVVLI